MEKIIQSDKLQAFEQKLRTEKGQVDQIFETAHPAADPTGSTIRAIYSLLGQDVYLELQREYAEAGTFGEKSALAVEMLDLTRNLKQIPTEIIDIYRRKEHIRELYTESKFDPYTFNYDFKVMKKRRLYEKVGEELFNHYINLLRHESDHTRLSSHIQRITALQDKLIELASKDTRKLERRLKSKSLPEEVHEILNLSLKE